MAFSISTIQSANASFAIYINIVNTSIMFNCANLVLIHKKRKKSLTVSDWTDSWTVCSGVRTLAAILCQVLFGTKKNDNQKISWYLGLCNVKYQTI